MKKRSGKAAGVTARTRVQSGAVGKRMSVAAQPNAIFLVGFMGAGKTSVGRALAEQLNWRFEDLDDRIESRESRSVAAIFRDSGEAEFRRAEHAALEQLVRELSAAGGRVVALGGGAFVQKENASLLQGAGVATVFLDAPVEELWQRCCQQSAAIGTERPLLRSQQQFRKLYNTRRKGYSKAITRVSTSGRSVDAVAAEIAEVFSLTEIVTRTEEGEVE